jgi:hypothetical protein
METTSSITNKHATDMLTLEDLQKAYDKLAHIKPAYEITHKILIKIKLFRFNFLITEPYYEKQKKT